MFIPKHLQERVQQARQKFGRPFAHEEGSNWKPNNTPFLTRYFDALRQKRQSA